MKSHQKSILLQRRNNLQWRRKKPSPKPINGDGEYSTPILPIDLIIEILSRLPAKSIARFRCLSKLWLSILRRPYFTELFFTISSSRPQVLVAFRKRYKMFFFSIPQLKNHDDNLSHVVATFVTKIPFKANSVRLCIINGLVFLREECLSQAPKYDTNSWAVICNPSTRQSLAMPEFSWRRKCIWGYDPIEKQYKLLSISSTGCQVLTLGSGNLLWRDILCSTQHNSNDDGICINGVLYYRATAYNDDLMFNVIVSFDIRSETFQFMKMKEIFGKEMYYEATLVNYNGKLGSVTADYSLSVRRESEIFQIWVLEDPEKQKWSHHIHVMPPLLKDVAGEVEGDYLCIVGMIGTDEIVLSPTYENNSFRVIYYNMNRKSVVKVEIQCMEARNAGLVYKFFNYGENLKFLF